MLMSDRIVNIGSFDVRMEHSLCETYPTPYSRNVLMV